MTKTVASLAGLLILFPLLAQDGKRLPDGRSQSREILKEDFKKSQEDVAEILTLARDLQREIDENREFSVNLQSIRKAEKIEDLAQRIKNRLRRMQ
jgi:uncharacterized tellurite resistance protein B-like protein